MWTKVLYTAAGVGAYLVWAILASLAVRRGGDDLATMESRNAPRTLIAGGIVNLLVLATVLALLRFLVREPVAAMGLQFGRRDLFFVVVGIAVTVLTAVIFLVARRRVGIERAGSAGNGTRLLGIIVLLIVATQEEVLFRGYIATVMRSNGWLFLIVSTAIFVAIHFLTNRVSTYQVTSWTLGGLVLGGLYIISGSLWVPILIHFAMDATNVLVFNISGSGGFVTVQKPLSDGERAAYRTIYAAILAGIALMWYPVLMGTPYI